MYSLPLFLVQADNIIIMNGVLANKINIMKTCTLLRICKTTILVLADGSHLCKGLKIPHMLSWMHGVGQQINVMKL